MTVRISNEQEEHPVDVSSLVSLAESVMAAEAADEEAELSVGIVDEDRMTVLNERYARGSGSTDVLAFSFEEDADEVEADPEEPLLLGDVVICPAVAARNAGERNSSVEAELSLLLVHGLLHLLGYDHADPQEAEAMRTRETELIERFGAGGRR